MKYRKNTYFKSKFTERILILSFLISVFSFSGYSSNSPANFQKPADTELLRKRNDGLQHVISFEDTFEKTDLYCSYYISRSYLKSTLLLFNRNNNISFSVNSNNFLSYKRNIALAKVGHMSFQLDFENS